MVVVRVPASSANLGPGFDCLGMALSLYNYVSMEEKTDGPRLQIKLGGTFQTGIAADDTNLVYQSAMRLWAKVDFKPHGIFLNLINNVPPSRGLGSSSAAIVGGLVAANILAGAPLTQEQLLELACEIEGHPDNVAAALYGGVTLAMQQAGSACICRQLGSLDGLTAVVAVPATSLSTRLARSLLPSQVPLSDAVWNLGHTALMVTAILTKDYSLLQSAMQDCLHEQYRSQAIPGMDKALVAAREAGALGAVLSGAGPSLLALTAEKQDSKAVGQAMLDALANAGIDAKIVYLHPDSDGAVQISSLPSELQSQLGGNCGVLAC
ncbi:MAG TPA: homoserine kinase [Desulfobacteria bacterium]|nr:homoserine kinase [Desulfobacteria bacterium]